MSYKAMDWVCEQPIADPTAKFVLLMIAKHADEQWQCYPSAARLAKLTGLDSRTVQRKVAVLKKQGYLFVSRRNNGGRQTSNLYTIHKPNEGRQSAVAGAAQRRPNIYQLINHYLLLLRKKTKKKQIGRISLMRY